MPKLEVDRLSKRYWFDREAREIPALDNISLSVRDGEFSTLLRGDGSVGSVGDSYVSARPSPSCARPPPHVPLASRRQARTEDEDGEGSNGGAGLSRERRDRVPRARHRGLHERLREGRLDDVDGGRATGRRRRGGIDRGIDRTTIHRGVTLRQIGRAHV